MTITSGTLVWTLVFWKCMPSTEGSMQWPLAAPLVIHFVNTIESIWYKFEPYLVGFCFKLTRCFPHQNHQNRWSVGAVMDFFFVSRYTKYETSKAPFLSLWLPTNLIIIICVFKCRVATTGCSWTKQLNYLKHPRIVRRDWFEEKENWLLHWALQQCTIMYCKYNQPTQAATTTANELLMHLLADPYVSAHYYLHSHSFVF